MLKERWNNFYNVTGPTFVEPSHTSGAFTEYQHVLGPYMSFWNRNNENDEASKAKHGTVKFFARFRVMDLERN